ncbi:MAG: methyltransferase domain-containing protein [Streptosporangiales bacterium]|nr:methyltransferase domain-containing protein [Streptosporangiales bacterium]
MLQTDAAVSWVASWDRQQEKYMADREERFAVIADVLETTTGRPDPLVVDVGCGPGSLAARILDRLPAAQVVGVDSDPLLLGLAAGAYGDRSGLRLVDADLRADGWPGRLGLDRPADAVVSTTALHWLYRDELARAYADFAGVLRPGGVFVDGDHIYEGPDRPRLDQLIRTLRETRAVRAGVPHDGTAWQSWWAEVTAAPELAELVTERSQRSLDHNGSSDVWFADRLELLDKTGFVEAGTVWQSGDDRVLVAFRGE